MSRFKPEFRGLGPTGISRISFPHMHEPDIIPLWFGEGDIVTEAFIREAAKQALDQGETFYANPRGKPVLRDALKAYLDNLYGIDLHPDRLTIPGSSMLAVTMAVQSALTRGDKALLVSPFWPNIAHSVQMTGADLEFVCQEERAGRWHLDIEAVVERITEKTKLIYVNSPCNPSGWVMEQKAQQTLLDVCRERDILILADEVYHRHVFDGRDAAPSFLSIAEDDDPVIVVNGFSKAWAMTGWRLGWMVAPKSSVQAFAVMAQCFNTGATTFAQAGGVAALERGENVARELRDLYRQGRNMVMDVLGNHPRIELLRPEGAFYAFPRVIGLTDSMTFAEDLVQKQRVGVAPGYTFGPGNEAHFRLCFACSLERLEEALGRIVRYLDQRA